ncbi:MAG: OB-fold nucleic acid binding domain-containing protein, partial [Candidatus Limisoma sp.]
MAKIENIDIKYLTGVGPKRAELLNKQLDIYTYRDLLYYFPFRYVDRSKIYRIRDISGEMPYIQICGRFISFNTAGEGAKRRLQALFTDGSGTIEVVWFNRLKAITESYQPGVEYILFGKPNVFNGRFSLAHPEVEVYRPTAEPNGLRGIYSLTDTLHKRGFTSKTIQTLVRNLFDKVKTLPETLPKSIIDSCRLIGLYDALTAVHMPSNVQQMQQGRFRLKF